MLAACGGSDSAAACPEVTPAAGSAKVLRELRLDQFGRVTAARDEPGLSTTTVLSENDVQELIKPVKAAIIRGGYTVLAEENDGFEADFKFNRGSDVHGIARISDDPDCDVRQIQVSVVDGSASASPS